MLDRRVHLAVDGRVVLAVDLAALRVPDEDVAAAELGEHGARHVAGVGTGVVRRQVLRAVHHLQPVAVDERLHAADVGERRQHRHLDPVVVLLRQREGELLHQGDGLEVVEVHLPVAGDQRRAGHQRVSTFSRTAMPGSSLPSRYSSDAPPPVEMWENPSSGRPSARTAAAESPPPTTLNAPSESRAVASMIGLGDAAGALGERGQLEHAHRAVPEHRLRAGEHLGERGDRLGADVEALPAVRDRVDRRPSGCSPRPRSRRRPPRRRQDDLAGLQQPPAGVDLVGLQQRVADAVPWAARKVKHIPPPTSSESTFGSSASMTASLSDTFEPPSTTT